MSLLVSSDADADVARRDAFVSATAQRLCEATRALELSTPPDSDPPEIQIASALADIVNHARVTKDLAVCWLLLTCLTGASPNTAETRTAFRQIAIRRGDAALRWLMDTMVRRRPPSGNACFPARIVRDGVVVNVDFCARGDLHSGIQKVVRETSTRWYRDHPQTVFTAWTDDVQGMRELTELEKERALAWGNEANTPAPPSADPGTRLVIPWRSTVVLAEVPLIGPCPYLAALAELSGNSVVAIGYDAIPIVSADLRPTRDAPPFAQYLAVLKHADRIAGISNSATIEFQGFVNALVAQGLDGPVVEEVVLPTDIGTAQRPARVPPARPRIVATGRTEPHKNHVALLNAAELLWREGVEFDLRFVGGPGWDTREFDRAFSRAEAAARPVEKLGQVSDAQLWQEITNATATAFVSLHEGFGLPITESLACGTPVITTNYGSMAEIAEGGGVLTVDPRDVNDIAQAMRQVVTDEDVIRRLRAEIDRRRHRTWGDYSADLWNFLINGIRP